MMSNNNNNNNYDNDNKRERKEGTSPGHPSKVIDLTETPSLFIHRQLEQMQSLLYPPKKIPNHHIISTIISQIMSRLSSVWLSIRTTTNKRTKIQINSSRHPLQHQEMIGPTSVSKSDDLSALFSIVLGLGGVRTIRFSAKILYLTTTVKIDTGKSYVKK